MFLKLLRRMANNHLSPLAHLLTSNNPPTNAEETLARNMIQDLQDSLTVLQLEIDNYPTDPRTQAASTDLEGHKTTIIKSISAHESIISPLRKLPPELLQVIFQETCWDPVTTFMLPWSLSQVCQSWRIIVHATPILWSCLTIVFDTKPIRLEEARLKVILQRSFNVDLRISICLRRRLIQNDKRHSLLLVLMAHSERWGYLNLDFTCVPAETILFLQAVKDHLPRLSQLHLKIGDQLQAITQPMTIDMFSVAPRLETVVIDNSIERYQVIVPVQQLTSYVRAFSCELITSLATLSHLVHLGIMWKLTTDQLEPRITFPRLKSLVIYFEDLDGNSANGSFDHFVLPCISEIDVRGRANGFTLPMSSMILRSSPCNLRTLRIDTFENAHDLTSLLLLTPQLQNLRICLPLDLDLFAASKSLVSLQKLQSLYIVVPKRFCLSFVSLLATFITTQIESEDSNLRTLQLKFPGESECRTAYWAMQPSPEVGELDDDVLALMNSWKKRLVEEEIPQLSYFSPHKTFINKLVHSSRLNQLFNAIEGYDIPTSGYLHVSDSSQN